jgi:CheY-like chemotaxis protein
MSIESSTTDFQEGQVLMSGYMGGGLATRARDAGADEVLKKPLLARDLAASLARVLHP